MRTVLPSSIPITCIGGDGKVELGLGLLDMAPEKVEERKRRDKKIAREISQVPGIPGARVIHNNYCQNRFSFPALLGRLKYGRTTISGWSTGARAEVIFIFRVLKYGP